MSTHHVSDRAALDGPFADFRFLPFGGSSPSAFAWNQIKRAVRRQIATFALVAVSVATLGAASDRFLDADTSLPHLLTIWVSAGFGLGAIIAVLRELSRDTIRSLTSLRKQGDLVFLGAAPELTEQALRKLPPDKRTPIGCLAFQPASTFATSFRKLQAVFDRGGVVAFIGPSADEGATTAALSTAVAAQQQGRRVIIVDCDLRRRSLSHLLDDEPMFGVVEAARDPSDWSKSLRQEDETGLLIMPVSRLRNPWGSLPDIPGFRALLAALRAKYDLVILDCPPALTVADGAVIARLADDCVLVASWDETSLDSVRKAMRILRSPSRRAPALYLNRVPAAYQIEHLGT